MARILVIDDNADNVRLLTIEHMEHGHQVTDAADAAIALQAALETFPDVILLDVITPCMDGIEACRRLKADPRTSSIPVLMLSALRTTARLDRAEPKSAEGRRGIERVLCFFKDTIRTALGFTDWQGTCPTQGTPSGMHSLPPE